MESAIKKKQPESYDGNGKKIDSIWFALELNAYTNGKKIYQNQKWFALQWSSMELQESVETF